MTHSKLAELAKKACYLKQAFSYNHMPVGGTSNPDGYADGGNDRRETKCEECGEVDCQCSKQAMAKLIAPITKAIKPVQNFFSDLNNVFKISRGVNAAVMPKKYSLPYTLNQYPIDRRMFLEQQLLNRMTNQVSNSLSKKAEDTNVFVGAKTPLDPISPRGSLRAPYLTPQTAKDIIEAMAIASKYDALKGVRVGLGGNQLEDFYARAQDNPRVWNISKPFVPLEPLNGLDARKMGDFYAFQSNDVNLPSKSPGILVHELGHAVDFNEYPANSYLRGLIGGTYRNLAPTLWKEHAAWRKGKDKFLEGAATKKLDPEFVSDTLQSMSQTKPIGLGSYWGGALGGLAGGLAGGLGAASFGISPLRPALIGSGLGAALGIPTGMMIGRSYGHSKERKSDKAKENYLNTYAKIFAKKHGLELDEAKEQLKRLVSQIKEKPKRQKAASYQVPGVLTMNLINYLAKLAACNASGTAGCSCEKRQCTQRETKCKECGKVNCNCKQASFVEWLGKITAIKEAAERGLWANIHAKRKRGEAPAKPGDKDYPDKKSWNKTVKSSGDAWQKSEGKNPEGGLNAKGRASLKAEGHDIKPPVTESNPKGERAGRKSSFCARMGGMKKKLTSSETANDPDSRINKALRKWNC